MDISLVSGFHPPMTDEQFRILKTMLHEQGVKIAELSLEVRKLKQAMETTEVVAIGIHDVADEADMPADVRRLLNL
ncbi:hypothetical protein [Shinella sp.]|uniref:hypothetical protein n=1 Tax=Shinella sp. TaxID=1870904 RepID=UPI003D29AE06